MNFGIIKKTKVKGSIENLQKNLSCVEGSQNCDSLGESIFSTYMPSNKIKNQFQA
jgi:hypothetical protein